ncbi:hypothetical protein O6B72_09050 [Campylobacter ureolyticus]|uniref:hypothetical protein n=1 Tax=Campylobacter ureolyticus TaxID=827 RepID=UPI0022B2DF60|nr:hypothetical protein [Campylobacter ureolyticus]MCZ6156953.1 hypothetical protein [Campylobacter ureolyticus]
MAMHEGEKKLNASEAFKLEISLLKKIFEELKFLNETISGSSFEEKKFNESKNE